MLLTFLTDLCPPMQTVQFFAKSVHFRSIRSGGGRSEQMNGGTGLHSGGRNRWTEERGIRSDLWNGNEQGTEEKRMEERMPNPANSMTSSRTSHKQHDKQNAISMTNSMTSSRTSSIIDHSLFLSVSASCSLRRAHLHFTIMFRFLVCSWQACTTHIS